MEFALDPRLAADTHAVAAIPEASVRLHKNAHYPWLIIVPHLDASVRDWHDLADQDRIRISEQLAGLSRLLTAKFSCDKTNVAAIGNIVPQLHIHVVGRQREDPAWPGVVWGHPSFRPYSDEELATTLKTLQAWARAQFGVEH
jgi:diadenosine tetraphosphate (Ap4A) HIT family hydrolase